MQLFHSKLSQAQIKAKQKVVQPLMLLFCSILWLINGQPRNKFHCANLSVRVEECIDQINAENWISRLDFKIVPLNSIQINIT